MSSKNEELENFLESVDNTLTGLQVRAEGAGPGNHLTSGELKYFLWNQDESCKVTSDLEAELELLRSTLEDKGAELRDVIREETQRKGAELQVRWASSGALTPLCVRVTASVWAGSLRSSCRRGGLLCCPVESCWSSPTPRWPSATRRTS